MTTAFSLLALAVCVLLIIVVQNVDAFRHHKSHPSKIHHPSPSPPSTQVANAKDITRATTKLNARPQTIYRHVQNNILTRRTVNDFEPTLPNNWERSLEHAIEAAIYAPNHKRTEPWRFYLLGPNAIEKVCKLNAELVSSAKGEAAGKKKLDRWLG